MCSRSALTSSDTCTLFAAVRSAELTDPISHSADRGGSSRNTVSPGKWAPVSPGEDRTNRVQDVSQCVCAAEHGVERGPPGSAIAIYKGVDRLEVCVRDRRGGYDASTETASAKSGESRFVLSRARGAPSNKARRHSNGGGGGQVVGNSTRPDEYEWARDQTLCSRQCLSLNPPTQVEVLAAS